MPRGSLLRATGWHQVGVLVVAAALILSFGLLAMEVVIGSTSGFDRAVIMAFRSNGNPADPIGPAWFQEAARDVTALGSVSFLVFVSVSAVGYLLLVGKRGLALLVAVAVGGGQLISTILKIGFDRPRPDVPHAARVFTSSFPSGHAIVSTVTFLTLGTLLAHAHDAPRVRLYFMSLAVFLTVMVGLSRLYLGLHYPTDVLAGWCAGAAWVILCWSGADRLQRRGDNDSLPEPHELTMKLAAAKGDLNRAGRLPSQRAKWNVRHF